MTIAFIGLAVSLLGLIGMLEYQAWRNREAVALGEMLKDTEIILVNRRMARRAGRITLVILKNAIHVAGVTVTKYRILAGKAAARFVEDRLPQVYALFSAKHAIRAAQESDNKPTSFFWRSVVEYKYKVKNLKEQIREEEKERKREEKEEQQAQAAELPE